jgi:hypothetical protein
VAEDVLVLSIPINQNTIKKIVALAALTGDSLDNIKTNIAGELIDEAEFDNFISSKLRVALGALDGIEEPEEPVRPVKKSFAQAEQQANIVDEIAGHSLSGDEDTGELTYSEKATQAAPVRSQSAPGNDASPFKINAPNAGDDAEAFLNSALDFDDEPAPPPPPKRVKPRQQNGPKVKISDYTGDESGENIF